MQCLKYGGIKLWAVINENWVVIKPKLGSIIIIIMF